MFQQSSRGRSGGLMLCALAAVLLVMVYPGGTQAASEITYPNREWLKTISPDGWTVLTFSREGDEVIFTKPAAASSTYRRIWARFEYAAPDKGTGGRSVVGLMEVDCLELRGRAIQANTFSGNNLSGSGSMSSEPPSPWDYGAPGSISGILYGKVCENFKAPITSPKKTPHAAGRVIRFDDHGNRLPDNEQP